MKAAPVSATRWAITFLLMIALCFQLMALVLHPANHLQKNGTIVAKPDEQDDHSKCSSCTPHGYKRSCFDPRKTKRIISYTLYKMPDEPEPRSVDTVGILQNLRLMRLIYPGWRMRIMIRSVGLGLVLIRGRLWILRKIE